MKNNANFAGISEKDINLTNRTDYIEEARGKFASYDGSVWKKDGFPELSIAGFDEQTGGFVVCHEKHNFDPTIGKFGIPRGDYEKNTSGILSKQGMSVVLKSEQSNLNGENYDGFLNGIPFEIKGIEVKTNRIIKDKISEASGQKAEIVVLYFHDKTLFDKDFVLNGYKQYLNNSKSKRIKTVYCVVENRFYKI